MKRCDWLLIERHLRCILPNETRTRASIIEGRRLQIGFSRMSDSGIQQEIEPKLTVRSKSLMTKSWLNVFEAEFHFEWKIFHFWKEKIVRSFRFVCRRENFVTRYIYVSFLQVEAVKRTAKTRKGRPRKALKQVWLTFLMCSQCVFCFVVEQTAYSNVY